MEREDQGRAHRESARSGDALQAGAGDDALEEEGAVELGALAGVQHERRVAILRAKHWAGRQAMAELYCEWRVDRSGVAPCRRDRTGWRRRIGWRGARIGWRRWI